MNSTSSIPLLLTLGEPAGIGPDCVLLAFKAHPELFQNVLITAPVHWLSERAVQLGMQINIHECSSLKEPVPQEHLGCWNPLPPEMTSSSVTTGIPSSDTAAAVIACIEAAAQASIQGKAAALITAPIEKAILRDSGFDFPGHTEFLASLAGKELVVMMLASDQLRVALLTTHLALRDVPDQLNIEDTASILAITHHDLKQRFGLKSPKLALCGLNPHAGEQQHFGDEEVTILTPAIEQVKHLGIDIQGPFPADTLFSPQIRDQYDAIICCYHDQALIPIKTLSFGDAVNVTLGLPFIRTSVDHGTALDRAGTGKVSYSSIMAAIKMAREMSYHSLHGSSDADQ
ncbi:MAG: 4-hydroxythreonine-4-phosphate dehydrogenase PdxA [Mariprofundaceae bacterium]